MLIYWKIRYLDRQAREFKDRHLLLETESLDALMKARVELALEGKAYEDRRKFLGFRHLFKEDDPQKRIREWQEAPTERFCGPPFFEYFEDETGQEITDDDMARILTGDPNAISIPHGAKQHDIDLKLATPTPIDVDVVSLVPEEIRVLAYFERDLKELLTSAFYKDGPGQLHGLGSRNGTPSNPVIKTATTDDEIRSFVTIFRRLYMDKEPANLKKAVAIYTTHLGNHPYAKWIAGVLGDFEKALLNPPELRPFVQNHVATFSTKLLIDVFLYTQYAHQPDERRKRQFDECLAELQGRKGILTWFFLVEIHSLSLAIVNAERPIVAFFRSYCKHHGITPDVLRSLLDDHPGIGTLEKEADRQKRLFEEKAKDLAESLWKQAESPPGRANNFLEIAMEQLRKAME